MAKASPVETVRHFMDCINQRDADRLAEWMTEDHVFIDSLGQTVCGREAMRAGWRGYYALCPDYWVRSRGKISWTFGPKHFMLFVWLRSPHWRRSTLSWALT